MQSFVDASSQYSARLWQFTAVAVTCSLQNALCKRLVCKVGARIHLQGSRAMSMSTALQLSGWQGDFSSIVCRHNSNERAASHVREHLMLCNRACTRLLQRPLYRHSICASSPRYPAPHGAPIST